MVKRMKGTHALQREKNRRVSHMKFDMPEPRYLRGPHTSGSSKRGGARQYRPKTWMF